MFTLAIYNLYTIITTYSFHYKVSACLCQTQDVRTEIAAFVPILWSKITEGKQSLSVVQCEAQTNAPHEATDQCDHDSLLQQKVFCITL